MPVTELFRFRLLPRKSCEGGEVSFFCSTFTVCTALFKGIALTVFLVYAFALWGHYTPGNGICQEVIFLIIYDILQDSDFSRQQSEKRNRRLSEMRAINSEFVGFPLVL